MGGLFGGKPPAPPAPAPVPTIDDAKAEQDSKDAARRRRGAAATILTGPEGVGSSPVGTKTLLGT